MPHERQAAERPVTGELSLGLVDEAVAAEGDRLLVAEAGAEAVGRSPTPSLLPAMRWVCESLTERPDLAHAVNGTVPLSRPKRALAG